MQQLFDLAFARLDRASEKRGEMVRIWNDFISAHPWKIDLNEVSDTEFEFFAVQNEPAPLTLSMAFSEWLQSVRSALDNGFYAWVAVATGQCRPPQASRLQYPICSSAADFKGQRSRLASVPQNIIDLVEQTQPYHAPAGPESNLFFWVNELARIDRHRAAHIGLGRVAEHKVRIGYPSNVTVTFDDHLSPWSAIDDRLVLCRFTTSAPVSRSELRGDFTDVGIEPEIRAWASFNMGGNRTSLQDRMVYTEIFARRDLESMTAYAGLIPPGGFQVIDIEDDVASQ